MRTLLLSIAIFTSTAFAETQAVGSIVPLTGDFAKYGQNIVKAVEQVAGSHIKFIHEDEGCNPKYAMTAYTKLTNVDDVKLFLGPWCGTPQTVIAPRLKAKHQVAILGSSAPKQVHEKSGGRMFSSMYSIEDESTFNAAKAYELGARRVAIVFFENDFSRAHEKAFRDNFKGEVLETFAYTSIDASILKSIALRIKALKVDTVYLPDAYPLLHGILKEFSNVGLLKDLKLFSVYSAQFDDVLTAVGSDGEGLMYSYPKIGDKIAIRYFPTIAAEMVDYVTDKCPDQNDECVLKQLSSKYNFDENGVLKGEIELRQIKDGKFTWKE